MAGLKPSVNLFALLDLNDPGDKLVVDFDNADDAKKEVTAPKHKKAATPAANHTKDLLGKAYPSARDYVVRKQQLERQAKAKARAEAEAKAKAKANKGVSGDGKSSTDTSKVQDGAKVQGGRYYYNNNEASRKQHPGNGMSGGFGGSKRQHPNAPLNGAAPVEAVEAPPAPQKAPPPPPSLYDINEFPSLK